MENASSRTPSALATDSRAPSPAPSEDEYVDAHDGEDLPAPVSKTDEADASRKTTAVLPSPIEASSGQAATHATEPSATPSESAAPPAPPTTTPTPGLAPTPARTPSFTRPSPLNIAPNPASEYAPSEGSAPMATAPTSPAPRAKTPTTHTPTAPHPQVLHSKPRLGGHGRPAASPSAPSTATASRSVSATMARAYAMAAGEGSPPEAQADEGEAGAEGDTPSFGALANFSPPAGLAGEDDEWVTFVRAQLVRLFPDFHDAEGQATMLDTESESEEEGEPSFRSELLAMRTEIGVLRGIVAELSETQDAAEEEADPAPVEEVAFELDTTALGLALAVVRALDASQAGLRADREVFAHDNLRALLAGVVPSDLTSAEQAAPVPATAAAPASPPAPAPLSPAPVASPVLPAASPVPADMASGSAPEAPRIPPTPTSARKRRSRGPMTSP